MKITRKDIPACLLQAYPDYKGRKFNVLLAETYYPQNYWDGGSRRYFKIMSVYTGDFIPFISSTMSNPFDKVAHEPITIKDGWCIIEHCIFQGKDLGLRFYVNHNTKFI